MINENFRRIKKTLWTLIIYNTLYGRTIKFIQNKTVLLFCIIHPSSFCQAKQNNSFNIYKNENRRIKKNPVDFDHMADH